MGRLKDLQYIGELALGKKNGNIPEGAYCARQYMMIKSLQGAVSNSERKRIDEGTKKKSRIMETFAVIKDIFLKKR